MRHLSRIQIASLLILTLVAVVAGLSMRSSMLKTTEADIIDTYVAQYLDLQTRGAREDCYAVPGRSAGVRLVVVCSPKPVTLTTHYEFHAGPLGGLVRALGPEDWGRVKPLFEQEGI